MSELPQGWRSMTLQQVAKWGSGGTPKAGTSAYYDGGIPWAVIGDLNDSVVVDTAATITSEGLRNSSAKLVPAGTLLLAMYGSIGKLGIAGRSMATNQAIAFGSPNEEVALGKYLFWFLFSQRDVFARNGKGATQQNISQTILKPWPIPVPPLDEQKRIVEILDDHFCRLDSVELAFDLQRARLEAMRRRLFDACAGHDGLPHPEWQATCFGEVAVIAADLRDPAGYQDLPHIAPNHIEKGTGRLLEYSTVAADGVTSAKQHFDPGQILYSKIRPYLNKAVLVDFEGLCSADMYPISTQQHPRWLLYAMLSPSFVRATSGSQNRTVLPKINAETLRRVQMLVPPAAVQARLAERTELALGGIERLAAALNKAADRIAALRRSLLHAAFTGQLTKEFRNG